MFTALMAQVDADQVLEWLVAVHSTSVRAHQHAAGAPFCGLRPRAGEHAIGRSRGGLTTKIHLAADGACRPPAFHLAGGQQETRPPSRT